MGISGGESGPPMVWRMGETKTACPVRQGKAGLVVKGNNEHEDSATGRKSRRSEAEQTAHLERIRGDGKDGFARGFSYSQAGLTSFYRFSGDARRFCRAWAMGVALWVLAWVVWSIPVMREDFCSRADVCLVSSLSSRPTTIKYRGQVASTWGN